MRFTIKHRDCVAVVLLLTCLATPARAQPPGAPASPPDTEAAKTEEREPIWTYGGGADFYFLTNLNNPHSGVNDLRTFDIKDEHGVHLNLLQAWVERARTPVGFRLDLNWGPSARLQNFQEASNNDLWEHVQEAYVSVNLKRSGSTYLDFGKWITPAGLEVVEPQDNVMYSHSMLFATATPYFHFGPRVQHYFNDDDYAMAAVHRGWNTVVNPGQGLGFAISGGKKLRDDLSATVTYIGGEELDAFRRPGWRSLLDITAEYEPSEKWLYQLDASYLQQSDVRLKPGASETATWYGVAVWAKRKLDEKQSVAARVEWFRDNTGFVLGDDADMYTLTLNYAHQFGKHLETRIEYRHDLSGGSAPFAGSRLGSFHGTMNTVTIAGLVRF